MNQYITPPDSKDGSIQKKVRSSNLELYRIIVMLMIVAHHYVVNSGLMDILQNLPLSPSSSAMLIFGGWGKIGINCFLLITGYFMCKSEFTWQKLLKLYLWVTFYSIIIYVVFLVTGHEKLTLFSALGKLWPLKEFTPNGFVSCFMMFYLFIPFLNIFLKHIKQEEYQYLIMLLLIFYGILPTFPKVHIEFNYVSWFMAIYIIAAYIRIYGLMAKVTHKMWGIISLVLILICSASILGMEYIYKLNFINSFAPYTFVADSNKIIPLLTAVSSFMYFKDLKIPQSKLINAIGGATFGVLLIHANSDAMRQWLWKETVDCVGHFGSSLLWTLGYAIISVLLIFIVCVGIDWFRGKYIEPHLMSFFMEKSRQLKGRLIPSTK